MNFAKSSFYNFVLFCLLFFSFCEIDGKNITFTILTFNDFYTVSPNSDGKGGFAGMSTLLKQEREKAQYHITTVNGDFLFPSILSSYDKAAHRIELMNDLEVDLVVIGNHEFDFGVDVLKARMREANFRWLAANAFGTDGHPFSGDEQAFIVNVEGIKVGFFGLITVETPLLSSTEKRVDFTPVVYSAKQLVKQLKKAGADVIVALTHLLVEEDRRLAQEVPEIDLILGGHDHEPYTWYNGRTFVHKSGQNAYFLTRIDLQIEKNEISSRVNIYPSWKVICNYQIPQDPHIMHKIARLEKQFEAYSQHPLATVVKQLDSTSPGIRSREMSMGNLVADAIRYSSGAEAALICGGIIRGDRIYEPGTVLTLKDVLNELPFNNCNVVVEMSGQDLLEALENGVSQVEGRAGRFPQVSGIEYYFDLNKMPGKRICGVKINGKAIERNAYYKVATVDYLLNGGDGYISFKRGRVLVDALQQLETVQSVVTYIMQLKEVAYELEERIACFECVRSLDDVLMINNNINKKSL